MGTLRPSWSALICSIRVIRVPILPHNVCRYVTLTTHNVNGDVAAFLVSVNLLNPCHPRSHPSPQIQSQQGPTNGIPFYVTADDALIKLIVYFDANSLL
jgi:hypothetical protein